jgi:hypothetical protein
VLLTGWGKTGVLSSHASSRNKVVPGPPAAGSSEVGQDKPKSRPKYIRWSDLLRRVLGIETVGSIPGPYGFLRRTGQHGTILRTALEGATAMISTANAKRATTSVARLAFLCASLEIVACSSGASEPTGNSPGSPDSAIPKVPSVADATLQWTKTIDTGADDEIAAMLAAPPSGVFILGTRSTVAGKSGAISTLSFEHPFVSSIDSSGNARWMLEINTSTQYKATGIATGTDGTLALVAETLDSQLNWGGMVAFVNDAGSLVSSFFLPATQNIDPCAVKIAPEGDVIVAGRGMDRPWVSRMSKSGTSVWTSKGSSTYVGHVADVAVSTDGSVSILSVDTTTVGSTMPMYVERLDPTGQVVWSKRVGTGYGGHIALDQNGTIYVATEGDNRPSPANVVVEYSADGTEMRRWAETDQEMPWGITVMPNGIFVLTGNFGVRRLSQFDPQTSKLVGALTVSDGTTAFAIIDAFNVTLGRYQGDDIGLEWLTIPGQ